MPVAIVRKGPSTIKYGGVDIGFTEGPVVFTYSPEFRLFVPDQATAAQEALLINEAITCVVPLVPKSSAESIHEAKAYAAGSLKGALKAGGGSTTLTNAEAVGSVALEVALETGFAIGERILIDGGKPNAEIATVASTVAGVITISAPGLKYAHNATATVIELDVDPKLRIALGNLTTPIPTAELLIDPQDGSDDIKIYKAIVVEEVALGLSKDEETIMEITYAGLRDTGRAVGDQLASIGDMTVA